MYLYVEDNPLLLCLKHVQVYPIIHVHLEDAPERHHIFLAISFFDLFVYRGLYHFQHPTGHQVFFQSIF